MRLGRAKGLCRFMSALIYFFSSPKLLSFVPLCKSRFHLCWMCCNCMNYSSGKWVTWVLSQACFNTTRVDAVVSQRGELIRGRAANWISVSIMILTSINNKTMSARGATWTQWDRNIRWMGFLLRHLSTPSGWIFVLLCYFFFFFFPTVA